MFRKIITLLSIILLMAGLAAAQPTWLANLNLQAGSSNISLAFGGDPDGTEGFDIGLDFLTPPSPPSNYYAYFQIEDPNFTCLSQDIRPWASPYEANIDWTLVVTNADGIETMIAWNPAELPAQGTFTLVGSNNTDMRSIGTVNVTGNQTITIQYRGFIASPTIFSMQIVNNSSLQLSYTSVADAMSYNVYRGTNAYFDPDYANGSNRIGTHIADENSSKDGIQWTDGANVIGDWQTNYFYLVTSVNGSLESESSNRVGEFDFELITTPTTDFNEIAIPLIMNNVTTASELMAAIPNCNSVARWNASSQGYDQYIPPIPPTNFAVSMGYPYYVNVTANTVFTLVGEYATPSFNLITTPTTDFNEIMLPLDRSDVTTASQLMAAVPNCNSIAKWNAQTQGYDQYIPPIPPTNFAVRVGYPYYVNVTANVVWPGGSAFAAVDSTGSSLEKEASSQILFTKAPHAVYGKVEISGDSLLAKDGLSFTAYILSRGDEKLNDSSPGCSLSDVWWVVQCASFPSAWQAGEVLHIEFKNRSGLLLGKTECTLTYEPTNNAGKLVILPEIEPGVPKVFSLAQNYPNPFNPDTEIRFTLPKMTHITLQIYNISGQIIKTLIDDKKEAGCYKVRWNAQNNDGKAMASGMYFCLLVASGYTKSIKLLLLK